MEADFVARVAHEINRAYCESLGDHSQPSWEDAPDWQKSSIMNGVAFHRDNPGASPSESHDNWLKEKIADGWTWGPFKNPAIKQHPCCVPYDDLPQEQRSKDFLFRGVVHALS